MYMCIFWWAECSHGVIQQRIGDGGPGGVVGGAWADEHNDMPYSNKNIKPFL